MVCRKRKIYFEKGKLYGPKLTKNIEENDYFIDCYEMAAKQTIEILSNNSQEIYKIKNIIAFLGNRGEGKTSMMRSYLNALKEKNSILFDHNLDNYEFIDLNIIDPSTFEDCSNVLDIVLGQLLGRITDPESHKYKGDENTDQLFSQFNSLYSQINIIKDKTLLNKYIDIYDGGIETLEEISKIVNFKRDLRDLIKKCLFSLRKTEKEPILVIPIDDIDIDLSNCYETVESLRKYLNIPNVLIIMAAKLEQLHEGIRLENLKKINNTMINDSERVYEDIYNMSTKYLVKLLPQNRRIHIPNIITNIGSLKYEVIIKTDNEEELGLEAFFSKLKLVF